MRGASRVRALGELRGPRELALFSYLTTFAATVPLLMRLPLPRLAAVVTRPPGRRRVSPATVERLVALVELTPRVAGPMVRTGCLTRGVTLFWFLRRSGMDVELRFGLDPTDASQPTGVDGHCWVTVDGEPFLEKVDPRSRFTEVFRIPVAVA